MELELISKKIVFDAISRLAGLDREFITEETKLIGGDGLLDSMKLVELCLFLEDEALNFSFNFDWTSEHAMSRNHSIFKNAGMLAKEFENQMRNS